MPFTVWLVKVLDILHSYTTEVWLYLLAHLPPALSFWFRFLVDPVKQQRCMQQRELCISVPPQECLGLVLRKHPAAGS